MKTKYKIGLIIITLSGLLLTIFFVSIHEPTGCISGDCLNGHGIMRFSNGNIYTGTWENGFMYGYGKQVMGPGVFEGDIYEGVFVHGDYNGKGTYFFSKYDAKLIGQFKDGKPHGTCTVFFGVNSLWSGFYKGNWTNGRNKEFEKFVKTTKNDETFFARSYIFYDTINHYYKSINLQNIIDEMSRINHLDLANEKISPDDIFKLVESINNMQYELNYSIEMIKTFMEYDSIIPYKKATVEYLNCFKTGIDNEFSEWILTIQHNPSEDKPYLIYDALIPFVERTNFHSNKWERMKVKFKEKYNIIRKNYS